ncbi:MAG: ImmA/IrrE family metallo-endopeptidase [Eubacteriales bacterium]|nr:ImmA/IrrE family metallo-endopeptidase [Eubacteriales bacterium]
MNNAAAIRAAGELLLSCGVAELPIDARKLLVSRGVKVMPYGKAKGEKKAALEKLIAIIGARDGFTIMDKSGRYTVMYSESGECAERIGFTLAHELAHIALNHEGALSAAGERLSREENEADAFARELLAPAALLLLLPKPLTDNDRLIFRLSNAAWKVRQ